MKQSENDEPLQPALGRAIDKTAWPALLHRVAQTVRSRSLFQRGQHVLVALSGGPDSVALLSILHHFRSGWKLTLSAVHCNYGLRGGESDGDQKFVEAFCQGLGVPLHVRRVEFHTGRRKASLQAEARDLRYRVMQEIAETCGADRIAIGHTADDQAETVLLWMLRGAGLTGLSGMPAFRDNKVIRPLYDIKRQQVLGYLRTAGLSFREDSSNSQMRYLRNRLRREVIPILNRLVPSSVDALCRLADLCREDDRSLDDQVKALSSSAVKRGSAGDWAIDRRFLLELPHAFQRRCIRNLFRQNDDRFRAPSIRTIDRIIRLALKRGSGSSLDVKGGRVVVDDRRLRFVPLQAKEMSHVGQSRSRCQEVLSVPGEITWSGTGQRLHVQQQAHIQSGGAALLGKNRILVDADRVSQPLMVRSWLPGDRFHPSGMGGHSKKLQDFFTDLKIPVAARSLIPLVVAPEGILWIVGYRQDDRWTPTVATKRCLVFTSDNLSLRKGTE
ncbi:MAG: tRNA lysidine(34) synthetase TilS [Nitrospira sp.]|nr:tRNA lysidine(34) synthetase TilS [Nitrospira sp.]